MDYVLERMSIVKRNKKGKSCVKFAWEKLSLKNKHTAELLRGLSPLTVKTTKLIRK